MIIKFIKLDNYFFVPVVRQTFLGFEMTSNFRDTSSLSVYSPFVNTEDDDDDTFNKFTENLRSARS